MNPLLTKSYTTTAAVSAYRIVKRTGDRTVAHATTATDPIAGVTVDLGAASGGRVDVVEIGIQDVEFAGTVAAGDPVTATTDGQAIKASSGRIVGYAMVAAVSGDRAPIMLAPGVTIGAVAGATITVGASDSGTVSIQLTDATGADLAVRGSVLAYLSDDANGDSIAGTAPDAVAIGSDGLAIPLVANKAFQLVSEADGDIDLAITEDGA
ncbi:MAG: hypothetical protein RIB84_22545, partial [Sneathiellaceae bacterium]